MESLASLLSKSRAPGPTDLLGCRYLDGAGDPAAAAARQLDAGSVLWLSYRRAFPVLSPYAYDSESGWGCMCNASHSRHARHARPRRQVRWFADVPGEIVPYSLHNLLQVRAGRARLRHVANCTWGPRACALPYQAERTDTYRARAIDTC